MFEITIKETRIEKKMVGGQYAVVGKRLLNEKDVEDSLYSTRNDLRQRLEQGEIVLMDVMGYTPREARDVEVEREVLKQTVDVLDLPAVIKAINAI